MTCSFRVGLVVELEFIYLGYVGELPGERGGGVRVDHLRVDGWIASRTVGGT